MEGGLLPAGGPEPDVASIAVLRANGLGDLVFAMPALCALRHAYPEAEIVLLGTEWHAAFLDARPNPVDRVVCVPAAEGVRDVSGRRPDPRALDEFFGEMRAVGFDLAVQLHGGGRFSNPFVRRLGARLSVGSRSPEAAPLDRWVRYVYHQPEVIRCLEVVALVGAAPVALEPAVAVTAGDVAEAEPYVHATRPLVVVHPGCTDPRRRWPPDRLAAVAKALAAAGADIVVTGSEPERGVAEAVVAGAEGRARSLVGVLSLGGLAGLLSRARLVLAADSGPLHLASAVGAPTVGIFWASNAVNSAPLTRSRHRPLASFRLDCPVCGLDQTRALCDHHVSYVEEIGVEEVLACCEDLLELPVTTPAALARGVDWRPGPGVSTFTWAP